MDGEASALRVLAWILLILGVVALVAGVVYFTVQTGKLPNFMGRIAHGHGHRRLRAVAGVIGGIVLLLASWWAFANARRSPSRP